MNQVYQNINKDMFDSDLIDVDSLDFSDEQTWLYTIPGDSGQKLDIVDWNLSCEWPIIEDDEYLKAETDINRLLDEILKNDVVSTPDKHKFDSRTYVKPKKKTVRPSIQSIVEVPSNPPSLSNAINQPNKYLTYNKYSLPLGPVSPMLRLKTFNVDTNSENSSAIKEYAMKRRSLAQDEDPQLEDADVTLVSGSTEQSHSLSKPINIDLSQPAHNLHNTFNKGLTNIMNERGSLNMYQSGELIMRMSPPSLVSSLRMENSGTFNPESLDGRNSIPSQKDSGIPTPIRESIDNKMTTSMTLSFLDVKDISTSLISQSTYPDDDSILDSLPPSLVSSVNSNVVGNKNPLRTEGEQNVFSSPTYTHLEQAERLLSARPRCQLYNNIKRDSAIRKSESYTKAKEESCQIDTTKVLNENIGKKDSPMTETVTLHYSNNKFRNSGDAEKENMNITFNKHDLFDDDMCLEKNDDVGKKSLNITLDKQELNEIIQARQKLSLARKGLPSEPDKLPNQIDDTLKNLSNTTVISPNKIIQLPNQTIVVPKQSMENASELLSRRRALNGYQNDEPTRDTPKRNATFKKASPPKTNAMDTTVVYVKSDDNQIIDINSATLNLIDANEKPRDECQERAMMGSSESTDSSTFSSPSPPDSVPETTILDNGPRVVMASTPHYYQNRYKESDINIDTMISPILEGANDKSYTLTKASSLGSAEKLHNTTVINSATMLKKSCPKRDILAGRISPEKKIYSQPTVPAVSNRMSATNIGGIGAPVATLRKSSLPTSKLRQYSSQKELNRIPGSGIAYRQPLGRNMARRGVYGSNPALSPTQSHAPLPNCNQQLVQPPVRRESYVIVDRQYENDLEKTIDIPKPTPVLVRQGTETLRREGTDTIRKERPVSQLVAPKDPPTTRPYSIAGSSQIRVPRPSTVPTTRPAPVCNSGGVTSAAGGEIRASSASRGSSLPRPSRLPAPRRSLRPPSVYSLAHTTDMENY